MTELAPGDDSIVTLPRAKTTRTQRLLDKIERDPAARARLAPRYVAGLEAEALKEDWAAVQKAEAEARHEARIATMTPKPAAHPDLLKPIGTIAPTFGCFSEALIDDLASPGYWRRSAKEPWFKPGLRIEILDPASYRTRCLLVVTAVDDLTGDTTIDVLQDFSGAPAP